jgi:hypothetical protein
LTYNLPAATDPEGKTCSIDLVSGPNFASLTGSDITFTPSTGTAGKHIVTLSVSDGGNIPQFTFNVIVTAKTTTNTLAVFVTTPEP